MTEEEIIRSFKEAKDRKNQITILSDLTLKPKKEIVEILERAGFAAAELIKKGSRRTNWSPEQKKKLNEKEGRSGCLKAR